MGIWRCWKFGQLARGAVAPLVMVLALLSTEAALSITLARVDGEPVTDMDMLSLADKRLLLRNRAYQDSALISSLVEEIILERLVTILAGDVDISQDWYYRTQERIELTDLASRIQAAEVALPSLTIDSAVVDSYYHANIARYMVPRPQRRVRQITVYKEGHGLPDQFERTKDTIYDGWDPKRRIDSVYLRLENGEDFAKLALAHSEDLIARAAGGDLGWVSQETLREREISERVFAQPLHLIGRPFESAFGWHILQVTGIREPGPAAIDARIEGDIRANLLVARGRQLATKVMDSLFETARIDFNVTLLQLPDSLIAPGMVVAVVNGTDTLWGAGYFMQKAMKTSTNMQRMLDPEAKQSLLRPMLRHLCLHRWLAGQGFLDREEVLAHQESMRLAHARSVIKDRHLTSVVEPDSAEMRAYYRTNLKQYTPARRHQIRSRRFDRRAEADSVRVLWKQGASQGDAMSHWVGPEDLPANVWNRVAAASVGSVVGPIDVDGGYELHLLERIAPATPFEQVRLGIAEALRKEKRRKQQEAFIRQASTRHRVERFPARFSSIVLPTQAEYFARRDSLLAQPRVGYAE